MRRFWMVVLALALVPVMAVPAIAKRGGVPGPPGPVDDEPLISTTCVSPWWEGEFATDDFTIWLDFHNPDACVDVLAQYPGQWIVTVARVKGTWSRPELMMVPRDAAWLSDSCGGEKRWGEEVFQPWVLPPANDERGFTETPAATVNACPGNAALPSVGEFPERVERAANVLDFTDFDLVKESEGDVVAVPDIVQEATDEVHPLAFVVWSHNLRKGDRISITVDLPDEPSD